MKTTASPQTAISITRRQALAHVFRSSRRGAMRLLIAILLVLTFAPAWSASSAAASGLDPPLQQAKALGAPMAVVARAIEIARQPVFTKKDVIAVFDISQ